MDSRFKSWVVAAVVCAVCLCHLGYALAAGTEKVGKIAAIRGDVQLLRYGKKDFRPAKLYEDVYVKDRVRTGPRARAKILYDDDSLTILSEKSSIEISEYQLTPQRKRKRSLIGLFAGKIRFIVTKYLSKRKPNFYVKTPTAVMGVRGSDSVAVFEEGTTTAYHLFGDLVIENPSTGESLVITSGQFAIIRDGQPIITGAITSDQLEAILGFFAELPPELKEKFRDRIQEELRQAGIEEIPEYPDLDSQQFMKEELRRDRDSGKDGDSDDGMDGHLQ